MLRTATRVVPRLALAVGSVALGTAGVVALRADLMVGYGVNKALEARQSPAAFVPRSLPMRRRAKAEVGDEVYWLTRGSDIPATPVSLGERLAIGDRITVTGRDGRTRHLEVVDLVPVGAPIHNVADAVALAQLVQVTCRVVGPAAGRGKPELVRFYIEADEAKPATLPGARGAGERLRQG